MVREEGKGFKTAFYEYHTLNEQDIGTHITRVYSIAINAYQRMADLQRALEALSGWNDFTDEEAELLMVLVYEAVIKGQRLRMGGRLAKIVKANSDMLKEVLSGGKVDIEGLKLRASWPSVAYIRPNKHKP